jgi:hypothetical protein
MINRTMPVSPMTLTIFLTIEKEACFDMIRVASETKPIHSNQEAESGLDGTREPEGSDRFLRDEYL